MSRISISNGRAIGFDDTGEGDGTPIVFLHGVGSDRSVWRPQLDHFRAQRRALAFDYPGYGDSDPAPEGTTRDDFATAIWFALDGLQVKRAHICGLSLGGVVAIAMHEAAPSRCASLILADSFAAHPDGEGIYQRSVAASSDLRALAEARVDVLIAQPAEPAVRSEVVETMARIDPAAYRIGAEAVWLAEQRERACAIEAPTLVLCGAEDTVTPPSLSRGLASLIDGARYEEIAGAGHLSNLEQPQSFNRAIDDFLAPLERAS